MVQLQPRSTPQNWGKVQAPKNWFSGHRPAMAQLARPVILSFSVRPAAKISKRSKDLLGMAGLKGSLHDFSQHEEWKYSSCWVKALQPWKFFTCWDKPPKQPRMRSHLSPTSKLLYLGWFLWNGELRREKGEGLIQSVLQIACCSSLLQLYASSHTSSTLTKAYFLQGYLIVFIKNKVNERSKIRYFKRYVPFCCHNKERYIKSTVLSWIQI